MFDLEKTVRVNMLLDFYSSLLTKKQVEYMELYFHDDLSLHEIASLYQVSRNAIYDNIHRSIKQLENYENKLQLLDKFTEKEKIINTIKKDYANDNKLINYIKQLEDLD